MYVEMRMIYLGFLSKRLKTIADSIISFESLADIGTDHAYLPIYLILNNKIKKAIATDINVGPLDIAKKNIAENGVLSRIDIRMGNGLSTLHKDEVQVIVISGMGGILIKEILEKDICIAKSAKLLILQPMRDSQVLRRWLYSNGFYIEDEELLEEDNKFYEIIWTKPGVEFYDISDPMLIGQKVLNKNNPFIISFIENKIKELNTIIQTLNRKDCESTRNRQKECIKLLDYYMEVLKCEKQSAKQ